MLRSSQNILHHCLPLRSSMVFALKRITEIYSCLQKLLDKKNHFEDNIHTMPPRDRPLSIDTTARASL